MMFKALKTLDFYLRIRILYSTQNDYEIDQQIAAIATLQ
jgi:hypothetical protein